MAIREKRTAYAVTLERDGRLAAEGNEGVLLGREWTPEHLFLAALARCTVGALRFHARRLSLELTAGAQAEGTVGRREDGSWGFLELRCAATVRLLPEPDEETVRALVEKAERGCFIGASTRPEPNYAWTVNDREL